MTSSRRCSTVPRSSSWKRCPSSFAKEHIPGAIRVDYEELERQAPERLPDKEAAIVTYCASLPCRNSEIAANKLVALGYRNVSEYAEGKADWIEAGLPVEAGLDAAAV